MLLTLRDSFDPFLADFDRFVRDVFAAVEPTRPAVRASAVRMDAIRRDDEIEFRFDLPGIDRDSLEVTIDQRLLTVRGSRSEEQSKDSNPVVRERLMGSFARRVTLPSAIDADKVTADYSDGVLTVRAPLAEGTRPRKVEISTDEKAITA